MQLLNTYILIDIMVYLVYLILTHTCACTRARSGKAGRNTCTKYTKPTKGRCGQDFEYVNS